jgi:CoA:oxalate CoA-transferase
MARKGPLSEVRVIDLAQGWGGPFCGQLLGDLGAEVIKVEPPSGEVLRIDGWGKSGGIDIRALNRNKKGIVLDLGTSSGMEAFFDLVKVSDVVLDNLGPDVLEEIGANYERLRNINPRVIYASIVGYGSTGPYSKLPVYEHMAEGITGMASICCEPGEKPIVQPFPLAEFTAGSYLVYGIVTALFEQRRTGMGRIVEVNLLDASLQFMTLLLQMIFLLGREPQPQGTRDPGVPVMGFYRCNDDNYIAVGPSWPRIARILDLEWMIEDPRWSNALTRVLNKQEMSDWLEKEGFSKADAEDWLDILRLEDVPSHRINTLQQVLEDPQVIHNKAEISMEHPEYGKVRAIDCPIKIIGAIEGEHAPPPTLGEHTEEVLKTILGYSNEKIARINKEQEGPRS